MKINLQVGKARLSIIVVLFTVGAILAAALLSQPIAPQSSTPILTFNQDCVDAFLADGALLGQKVCPVASQRGVGIDGTRRVSPLGFLALNANSFEGRWGAVGFGGLSVGKGTFLAQEVDLALPAPGFSWTIGRSYNAIQERAGVHYDSNGPQGWNWFQTSQVGILLYEHASDPNRDIIYFLFGADRFLEYQRVELAQGTSQTFRGTNGATGVVLRQAGGVGIPDTYHLTDSNGSCMIFFGFDGTAGAASGQLWKITDTAGNCAFVGHQSDISLALQLGYSQNGCIQRAYDTADRRYSYNLEDHGGVSRIEEIVVEEKEGGNWDNPVGVVEVASIQYAYYGEETSGRTGDLKAVSVVRPLSFSSTSLTKTSYYRYYTQNFSIDNPGHVHAISYVLGTEGARRMDWLDEQFNQSYYDCPEDLLEQYAEAHFEYSEEHKLAKVWFSGECGCGSAADGEHSFEYDLNPNWEPASTSQYDDLWRERTVISRPDGCHFSFLFDEGGQLLTAVFSDDQTPAGGSSGGGGLPPEGPPDNPASGFWVWHCHRGGTNGSVERFFGPDAILSYSHDTGSVVVKGEKGLVTHIPRISEGTFSGLCQGYLWSEGNSGQTYYLREYSYAAGEVAIGDGTLFHPYVSCTRVYVDRTTVPTGGIETAFAREYYEGSLATSKVETFYPEIPEGQNGPGIENQSTSAVYYRLDGTRSFAKSPRGIVSYKEYTNGHLYKRIADADTAQGADYDVDVPVTLVSMPGATHFVTHYAFDSAGGKTTILPSGQKPLTCLTQLGDSRIVKLTYANHTEGTPSTYYGPIGFEAYNHDGHIEISGSIALANSETDIAPEDQWDPTSSHVLQAMQVGEAARLSVYERDKVGGKIEAVREYHSIPAGGDGEPDANYDQSKYEYTDSGNVCRIEDPTGTITAYVRNSRGLVERVLMGTDDSGSNSDNMTLLSSYEYDEGQTMGPGLVTNIASYPEGYTGHGDPPVGSVPVSRINYKYDCRGRRIAEEHESAPHMLSSYDERGLITGIATIESFSGLDLDQVGALDNQLPGRLSAVAYSWDNRGRNYLTEYYAVDQVTGNLTDSIEYESWYDNDGNTIKVKGRQAAKHKYDQFGRQTHSFVIGKEGSYSSEYAAALSVDSDHVLVEDQFVYDAYTSNVVLRLAVERHPLDDSTLGPLDANQDDNPYLVTPSDMLGRPQVQGHWYDPRQRHIATAHFGTCDLQSYDRQEAEPPDPGNSSCYASAAVWADDGGLEEIVEPGGMRSHYSRDHAGRLTRVIANYDPDTNNGEPAGTDLNQTVGYEYQNGLLHARRHYDPNDPNPLESTYFRGTELISKSGDSYVATGHLLKELRLADYGDGAQPGPGSRMFSYNALGQVSSIRKADGTTIEYEYDAVGRPRKAKATILAPDIDKRSVRLETNTIHRAG